MDRGIGLTSNIGLADLPGNVILSSQATGLANDSVANASQVLTIDKRLLTDRVGKLPRVKLDLVLAGSDTILGR